jgi:hypothetical protein
MPHHRWAPLFLRGTEPASLQVLELLCWGRVRFGGMSKGGLISNNDVGLNPYLPGL